MKIRLAQYKKEKVGTKEMHKKDKWTLFEGPDLLRGEQPRFCLTFWSRTMPGRTMPRKSRVGVLQRGGGFLRAQYQML